MRKEYEELNVELNDAMMCERCFLILIKQDTCPNCGSSDFFSLVDGWDDDAQ